MILGRQGTPFDAELSAGAPAERARSGVWPLIGHLSALLLLFGIALLLRRYRLAAQSLWLDEGHTWNYITQLGWGPLLTELVSPNAAYPLYHLLMKGWIGLFGDSELALRMPSALAGALAVPVVYLLGKRLGGRLVGLGAALLMLVSPFALWQSQDAKAYSLQILVVALGLLLFWDALMLGGRWRWLVVLAVLLLALLAHRLSMLSLIGGLVALQLPGLGPDTARGSPLRSPRIRRALLAAAVGMPALAAAGLWWGLQRAEGVVLPQAPAGPLELFWPTFEGLALYRSSPPFWLALPFLALFGWGAALLIYDLLRGRPAAAFIVGVELVPLSLYLLLVLVAPHPFEARYLSALFPLFLVVLVWPLRPSLQRSRRSAPRIVSGAALLLLALVASGAALLREPAGLFSGAPVKEDYRQAVDFLARKVHPDDVVIVSPHYLEPLYRYYAARVTPDPLPAPAILPKLGAKGYDQGEFDEDLSAIFHGHRRAWLLEAPLHAMQLDPPPKPEDVERQMGKLAVNFYWAAANQKWSCGPQPYQEYLGLRVYCQSFPETYGTGEVPEPAVPLHARFGETIELRGYELNLFPDSDGRARAGGTLPVTLFWRSTRPLRPDENYIIFLHLVPSIGERPVAQEDVPPLEGGLLTNTWIGTPVHDQHAIPLPADLEPGRYILLLGLYDPNLPGEAGRLPVRESEAPAGETYIELATVEVVAP